MESENSLLLSFSLCGSLIFLSLNSANAATYTVNNAADFNALPRLNAGDVVQMNSGTYGAIKMIDEVFSMRFFAFGKLTCFPSFFLEYQC